MLINLSGLASGSTAVIYLARRIDVAAFKEVTAYVRLHTGTTISVTPTSSLFQINADGYTSEDPAALDASSNPAFQTNLVNTDIKATPVGGMLVIPVTAGFGSMLSLSLQYTSLGGATIKYIMSVDLICKEF